MATTIIIVLLNTLTYAICGNGLSERNAVWRKSPRITPWGVFGSKEFCPNNGFVTGMHLKMDHKHLGDNTALNAVNLICLDGVNHVNITSSTGRFGRYGKSKYCPTGFATGFRLRSQNGQGLYRDDVAAVDFKLLCTDGNGTKSRVVDHDNAYLPWGSWTTEQHCPSKYAVCGIVTQLDDLGENLKKEDETALNNVDIACCRLYEPIRQCQLNYNWETIIACHNEASSCEAKLSIGFAETEQSYRSRHTNNVSDKKFDAFVMKTLKAKAKEVPEKINNRSLELILRRIKIKKKNPSLKLKCENTIQQLVVTCAYVKLYTHENRCVPDQYDDEEWDTKGLYFRPTSRSETIFWSYNCDFIGDDIADKLSDIADCGHICLSNEECTHFAWNTYNGGTCWMKASMGIPIPLEIYNKNILCGWIERPLN